MVKQGYKQTEIGIIPEDWEVVKLITLSHGGLQNGVFYEVKRKGTGVKLINVGDLYKGAPIKNNALEYFDANKNEINRFSVNSGDLFFTRSSVVPSGIAYCNWFLNDSNETVVFDSHVIRLKTNLQKVNPMYLFLQCTASTSRRYFVANSKTAAMTTIDQNVLGECPIIYSPLPEQKAIAEALSDANGLIASLEKLIEKKKAIEQGAMQRLLTGKRRLPGFNGEWAEKKLGNISHIKTGDKNNDQKKESGKYPFFVRSQQVERIDTYSFEGEAILIPGEGNIGQIFHYFVGRFDWHQRVYKISNFPDDVYGKYVFFQMKNSFGKYSLQNTVKATVDSLRLPVFKEFMIKIPPTLEEQTAIANILTDMDAEIEALQKKLAKARLIKRGMMQELLTGRIRLVNIEDKAKPQPASVTVVKKEQSRQGHNRHFEDAVLIAAIVDAFYSDKYPLGRVKIQKLLYLLRRKQEASVAEFKKKAAGPYADEIRYKGGEPIAKANRYIVTSTSENGTRYGKGEYITQALGYIEKWNMQADVDWLKDNFLHTSRNELELLATIDMAMCDLTAQGKEISVANIKELIRSDKEWNAKLKKAYFSDIDIQRAIKENARLFG